MRRVLSVLLLVILSSAGNLNATEESAEKLLGNFEHEQTAQTANAFFEYLLNEGFVDEPITIAKSEHTDSIKASVWYWAAEWYYDQQDYAKAEEYGLRSMPLCESAKDKTMEADCASLLSIIYVRQGNFQKAATYAKQCNRLDIESGNKDNIASSYNTLAGIYMSAHEVKEAEKYVLKAIEYAEQTDNLPRQAVVYGMAAEVYQNMHDVETSLQYADKALAIERQLGRQERIAIRQAQRAPALIGLKRYDEAEEALAEAIPVLRVMSNRHSLGIACVQMGDVKHKLKQDEAAIGYYDEAVDIFEAQHDLYNLSQAHDGLREAWRKIDPQKALEHNDKFLILQDSLYDKETGELLSKYAAEYDNEMLQKQSDNEKREHRLYVVLIVCAFLLILIVLSVLATVYYRKNKKSIAIITREMEDVRKALLASAAVTQAGTKRETTGEQSNQDLLARVVAEVEKALEKRDYNVEAIAERMGMGVRTFRRRIQELTGGTPKDFICAIQMEKARSLLLSEKQMKIEEVAVSCGFEDASSFSHTFSRIFGMSPTQFRKQNSADKG